MRVLVCGGRDYSDNGALWAVMDELHRQKSIRIVIEGGATGADRLGREWADRYGIHVATVLPRWDTYGKAAGPLRNAAMLELQPDMVIACPGGRGTANMVKQARESGALVLDLAEKRTAPTVPDSREET